MLIEGITKGPLVLEETSLLVNSDTGMYDARITFSQLHSYGKYKEKVFGGILHYREKRVCSHVFASYYDPNEFSHQKVDNFFEANKNGVIFSRKSFEVEDVLDSVESNLLLTCSKENERLADANKSSTTKPFHPTYQDSLNYFLDKYVCLNEEFGYEFYGIIGRYQYAKSFFSITPKNDIDFRTGISSSSAIDCEVSQYLTANKQRITRATIELEDERKLETVELMTAKHYELTNHFKNVTAAVVLCGNPKNLSENLKIADTYINASNEIRVAELAKDFMMNPIDILDRVRRMGTAYFISPGGRFQNAFENYINTCFIITGFLFGSVNAGVRAGVNHFFDADVSAADVLSIVLCNVEYLKCECELLEDFNKRESLGKSLRSLREKVMELYV